MKKLQNSKIKYGTIFQLGQHHIAYGDCRDKALVTKLVGRHKIKAVVCDPPFGVAVASKNNFHPLLKNKPILNDHLQTDEEYRIFTKNWMEAIKPHLERKNSLYIFNADKMLFACREGLLDAGGKFGQLLIWVKTGSVVGRLNYCPQHELIIFGWIGVHEFFPAKDKTVLVYPKPNRSPLHPTTKPINLIRRLVMNSTRVGDVVFDGFLGSGTTLLGCQQSQRICLGVEIDPEYILTIIRQFEQSTGQKARRLYAP